MKQIATCSLAFIFLFVTFIGPGTAKASDKAVRFAIVKEWKGSVTVTKSGGDKPLQVFNKMSINQGDRIETGPKSSVVLQLAGNDEEDELTIGADADVSFTELKIKDGVKTRIGVLAGSVFTKVKSLTGADDRFELETPTAVMAVRGTQFGVYVHPRLGWTQLHVIAGVVQAEYPVASEIGGNDRLAADRTSTSAAVNNQGKITQKEAKGNATFVTFEHQFVYPAQSATFIPARGRGIEALYEYANIEAVLTELDPAILRSMVTGYADAAKENDQYVKAWQKDGCAVDYSGLVHKSCEILRSFSRLDGDKVSIQAAENEQSFEIRVAHNMKVYLAALVRVAVDSGMLTRKEADASRIPWREATLQISETERQQQHWVLKRLEKWISEQKRVNPHDSSIAGQASAGCKQRVNGIESQVLDELEWKYANSLSPSERIRFIENLKVARLEICKNTYEYLVCCESSSPVADGSLGNRDGDVITPDPDPKPDPDPDPDPKPDPDPDPDPKPDPDPDPDPKPDPDPDPDPKPDPDPDPDPKPDPDPDPDPKPDPDPDPDPQPQAHVFEIASSVDHVAPNSRLVVDMVLKRLKTKLNVVAVEFTVEVLGGTLDSIELNDDKAVYRHGGSKFVIAHHPDDYDKSNSVDSITVSGNRFVYRLVVTTPETVSLESDDQILSLPYIAGESGTMSLTLSEVRFYDATGALLELNTMDQPLEIMVNP